MKSPGAHREAMAAEAGGAPPGKNEDLESLAGEVAKVDMLIAPAPVTDQNPPLDTQAVP